MYYNQHHFHIPVMGTGHSVDSPIRVAPLGINSVISVVDDLLLEKVRKFYCGEYSLPYENIPRSDPDGRARRVNAYLETVREIVNRKFEQIKSQPLFSGSDKDRYFRMLPDANPLKTSYDYLAGLKDKGARMLQEQQLTAAMQPGATEVNIMAKVDALLPDKNNEPRSKDYSDAVAALRGYAQSSLPSTLVLSAGFNPRLYSYISEFMDFYRDQAGRIKKQIALKVSDFRSALIQGKFLANKGIEISEFRIESGLNCGGHAFATDGHLLPVVLKEFRDKRHQLVETFRPLVRKFYEAQGWDASLVSDDDPAPAVTVQGGIGTSGEARRLLEQFDMDSTGWGSPFLLVPEATCVDEETSTLLEGAGEQDLYLSGVSPLGVPFNNVRGSGSEAYTRQRIDQGKPGSKCPKGFLVSNTEFTENPICTASQQYQLLKIDQIEQSSMPDGEKEQRKSEIMDKNCLCQNLGAGAMIRLGIQKPDYGRQAICPGPNIAWFDRSYTLQEMVDHIYGRSPSIVPRDRPHMFAKELVMYVDYLEQQLSRASEDEKEHKRLTKFAQNLELGMQKCLEIAHSEAYHNENLTSLRNTVDRQRQRLEKLLGLEAA